MKIYNYESYDEYVEEQTKANKKKITNVWVRENVLSIIKMYYKTPDIILCHGTRNAAEQKIFKKFYPEAKIMGTEISETASQFPNTINHDFHEELPQYVGKCDIVYSNSFDHSYDPEKCMKTWVGQVKEGGHLFLELMIGYENRSKASDPLEISRQEVINLAEKQGMKYLITETGRIGQSELLVFKK